MKIYQATQYLVIFSTLMSVISFVSNKKFETAEFYPFFHWKLFPSPPKVHDPFTLTRLYIISKNDTIRLSNDDIGMDNVIYNSWLTAVQLNLSEGLKTKELDKKIIEIAISKSKLNFEEVLIVNETYKDPINITKSNAHFTKEILYKTKIHN